MPKTILTQDNSPLMRYALGPIVPIKSAIRTNGGTYHLNFVESGGLALEEVKDSGRTISTVVVTIDRDDVSSFGPIVFAEFSGFYFPVNRSYTAFTEEDLVETLDQQMVTWARELKDDLYEQIS